MCFVLKFQYFNGLKFTRDDKSGYYLNSTIRKRMHRYVWEYNNGAIPEGHHIHHIDGDKVNNDISNLQLLSASEHVSMHAKEMVKNNYDAMIKNLNENVRPKASEWHGSKEGHEWHKEQYKIGLGKFFEEKVKKSCEHCAKEYETINSKSTRFCSNGCKTKWRWHSGLDNENRICEKCGTEFQANKYSKTVNCSRSCSMKKKV